MTTINWWIIAAKQFWSNLVEGILFVTFVVFLFMLDWRTVIVSIIIPLALLFAFGCALKLKGMSANLLSMGAIDFGIIIDGAVVMVEGIFVVLARAHEMGMPQYNNMQKLGIVKQWEASWAKTIFFQAHHYHQFDPNLLFRKIGRQTFLASRLHWFRFIGALFFTLTLVPVLSIFYSIRMWPVNEKSNR